MAEELGTLLSIAKSRILSPLKSPKILEDLDYNKDYTIEEYEKILDGYNDRKDFPNIN